MGDSTKKGRGPDRLLVRERAVKVLLRVEDGGFADRLLDVEKDPAVRALVKGALQEQGAIDAALSKVCHDALSDLDPKVRAILRCGALQIMFNPGVPPALVVNESVALAKNLMHSGAGGVVNAVLRKIKPGEVSESGLVNFPKWIAERWCANWGSEFAEEVSRALSKKTGAFLSHQYSSNYSGAACR